MNRPVSARTLSFAIAAAVVLLSASLLQAQVDTGSITGVITDASGAVVSGASVKLINEGTNAELTTTAGSGGDYKFSPVRIGNYTLTASFQGFQTTTQRHVTVNVSSNVVVNLTTGGSPYMTVEERVRPAATWKPEVASLNMGSMNFGLFPMLKRYKSFKHDWEPQMLEGSHDLVFRNSFRDIRYALETLNSSGARYEFE